MTTKLIKTSGGRLYEFHEDGKLTTNGYVGDFENLRQIEIFIHYHFLETFCWIRDLCDRSVDLAVAEFLKIPQPVVKQLISLQTLFGNGNFPARSLHKKTIEKLFKLASENDIDYHSNVCLTLACEYEKLLPRNKRIK